MVSVIKIWKRFSKQQKILFTVLLSLLLVDFFFLTIQYLSPSSPVKLSFPREMHSGSHRLHALNTNARTPFPEPGYAYYQFTRSQKRKLLSYSVQYGDAAVVVRVQVKTDEKYRALAAAGEIPFMYGFLFENDFKKNGAFKNQIDARPLVSADLRGMTDFELSLSVQNRTARGGPAVPEGFFVYSPVSASVTSAAVRNAAVGWDTSGPVPFYGFAPSGGRAGSGTSSVDFSDAAQVFPRENGPSSCMPLITVTFAKEGGGGTADDPVTVPVNAGGQSFMLFRAGGTGSIQIHTAALADPFAPMGIADKTGAVTAVIMTRDDRRLVHESGKPVTVPFQTDPGFIMNWQQKNWRIPEYELFEWDRFKGVLFFDTKDYAVQNDFFRRLAYYAEKTGYRGTLVSDGILKNKHGYNAHDYSAETLAGFFTKAEKESFTLNAKEYLLRDILLANGVIEKKSGGYKPGQGAVISISRDSAGWLRSRFIAHEGWHGIFFTDEKFRGAVTKVYDTMDPESLEFLKKFWHTQPDLDYDMGDAYLVHNEFMAYLMQQPLSGVADYFVHLANRGSVMKGIPELAAYVRRTGGKPFEEAAGILNEYAFNSWGLACGRVSLVR